jgi:hypothetical protein
MIRDSVDRSGLLTGDGLGGAHGIGRVKKDALPTERIAEQAGRLVLKILLGRGLPRGDRTENDLRAG